MSADGSYRTNSLIDVYRRQNLNACHYALRVEDRLMRTSRVN